MRGLHAHYQPLVLHRHLSGGLGIHVVHVLFESPAAHTVADDVEHRQDAGLRTVNDAILEVFKVPPAGTPGVHHRGYARAIGEAVRVDAVVPGVGAPLPGARVDVNMNVDEAGRDVEPGDVHRLERASSLDAGRHQRDLAVLDSNIADRAQLVLAVDDVPALE